MEKATAQLVWSCIVVCPECAHDNDLATGERYDDERDRNFVDLVFSGDLDKAPGFTVACEFCHTKFQIKAIEREPQ